MLETMLDTKIIVYWKNKNFKLGCVVVSGIGLETRLPFHLLRIESNSTQS